MPSLPSGKAQRHEQIIRLIRERPMHSQQDLAEALRDAGVETTQVTLSRDLKELGLVKTPAGYATIDAAAADGAAARDWLRVLHDFVREIRRAQNLLVVRTTAGAAAPVGVALDGQQWEEVAGSLAGDDTVLLICADNARCRKVEARLRELLW